MGGKPQPGWLQNRFKNRFGRGLGRVLEGLGRLLATKTEKREELPVLGAHLGAVLGASRGRLGVVLGGSGVQDEAKIETKMHMKID